MKTKALHKDIRKSITHSMGRFISIMLLMLLGSFALVGLFVTGPNMRETGTHYFNELNVADITILSTYGLDESEIECINNASNILDVEYSYLKDVVIEDTITSFRIFSKSERISQYELVEGNFPTENDEIAIASKYQGEYEIGDTIKFTEKADEAGNTVLKQTEFTIVGFINSSDIIISINNGQSTSGTGELEGYAIVNEDVFDSDVYMMAKLTFTDTQNLDYFSDEYSEIVQEHKMELKELLEDQQDIRFASIKSEYQEEIDNAQKEVDDAKQELEDARVELENASNEIAENEKLLADAASEISSSEKTLKSKQSEYDNSVDEYNQKLEEYNSNLDALNASKSELESAKSEISSSQQELDNNLQTLENAKSEYSSGISKLTSTISNLENLINSSSASDEELYKYQTQLSLYSAQLEAVTNEYETFMSETYTPGIIAINAAQDTINQKNEEIEAAEKTITESEETLNSAKSQLDSASKELASAKSQLSSGYTKLANAKKEYNSGVNELNNAKAEYEDAKKEFDEKEAEALAEIADAESEIADAQDTLDALEKPTYSVYNRAEAPGGYGYEIYETIADIVDSLARIFPVFLYFVAALVTLTTMTRFVSEERINIGTLKSLGYEDKDIIKKFTIYGAIAGLTGTILGIILGHTLMPYIVYSAYRGGYTLPAMELHFHIGISITAIILSLVSSVIPTYIVAKKALQEKPAELLLPKAPKAGSKIFLERLTLIWNKLSFTKKVTARNIFRYKSRMFMTIFGVAGAAALLFAGFSVQSSISGINKRQFEELLKYDIIVSVNDNIDEEESNEIDSLLNSSDIKSYMSIYYESATKESETDGTQKISIIIPENDEELKNYVTLVNRKSQEEIALTNDGVIVSEKFADVFDLKVGDTFTFTDDTDTQRTAKVSAIAEMYASHFMLMTSDQYEEIYGKEYETNAKIILLNESTTENTRIQSAKFMELSGVQAVVQNTMIYDQINTIVESLNQIMLVLIVVAGLLGIVILYNLTNINVAERIRELCTIKVLGFYDNEVTMYIYRETIMLSILGVIVGWGLGLILHSYILAVVPPSTIMFSPSVWIGAYIIPFITIAVISVILGFYINRKLKYVDMLEALKSVD